MKFMILVKSNPRLEKRIETMSASEMKQAMADMEIFNDELRRAGVMRTATAYARAVMANGCILMEHRGAL